MKTTKLADLSVLVFFASVLSWATQSAATEADCKKPRFKTGISDFMAPGGVGTVGFSFNNNPLTVQRVSSGDCYQIPKKYRGRRAFFFMSHRTTSKKRYTSFMAVQVVKHYKSLRFEVDRVAGVRKGSWSRNVDGSEQMLAEVYEMSSFNGISPENFGQIHKAKPFDETPLLDAFTGAFWHAKPLNSNVSSLDRLPYWSDHIPDDPTVKVENYLIRFKALASEESPKEYKNGIPFDTHFNTDLGEMTLSVRSPADGGIQVQFSLK